MEETTLVFLKMLCGTRHRKIILHVRGLTYSSYLQNPLQCMKNYCLFLWYKIEKMEEWRWIMVDYLRCFISTVIHFSVNCTLVIDNLCLWRSSRNARMCMWELRLSQNTGMTAGPWLLVKYCSRYFCKIFAGIPNQELKSWAVSASLKPNNPHWIQVDVIATLFYFIDVSISNPLYFPQICRIQSMKSA